MTETPEPQPDDVPESSAPVGRRVIEFPDLPSWEKEAIVAQASHDTMRRRDIRNPDSYRATLIRRRMVRAARRARRADKAERLWRQQAVPLDEARESQLFHRGAIAPSPVLADLEAIEFVDWLDRRAQQLPFEQRVTLDWIRSERPLGELAQRLNVSPQAASSRVWRLRKKLRAEWQERSST